MEGGWLLCDSPIWDWDLSWHSVRPLLTPCFRRVVLSLIPCAVLWLTAALASRGHSHHKCGPYPWTTLALCKQMLTVLLIGCCLTEGVYQLYREGPRARSRDLYLSVCFRLATYVLTLWLQVRQRREGHITSLKLALFWNLHAVAAFIASPVYDLLTDSLSVEMDEMQFVLGTCSFALVASEAFASHFTDPQYKLLFDDSKTDEYLIDHQAPLSRLLFTWLNRLIWYGYKNVLGLEDLDALQPDVRTNHVCDLFLKSWSRAEEKTRHRGRPSLLWVLARVLWPWMLVAALLELAYDFLTLAPPLVLEWLIAFTGDPQEPAWHGPVYALLLFGAAALNSLLMVHNQDFLIRASVIPRSGLNAAIYRKVFRLSLCSRRRYSLGELCNLVTVDGQRIFELVWSVNQLWSNPLRMALTVALLWRYLGPACLVGVAALLLLMPLTALLASRTQRVQRTQMELKDSRLRLMNEILNGIKVLKLFAWEPPFVQQVREVRESETGSLRKLALLNGALTFLWKLAPFLVSLCSFGAFVLLDSRNVLDPATAFVSLALFGKLRGAVSSVPQIILEVVQCRVSFRRVVDFLLSEELDPSHTILEPPAPGNVVELESASFCWGGAEEPCLRELGLAVRRGDLVAVVGRVGAGKSALLSALLGEMTRTHGTLKMEKELRVASVPQVAWIQNTSLRQNVLFVSPMDKRRYDSVVRRCCLRPDLKTLPAGDHTEIGEKGVNLSGGQKQRVSLARAVYHNAELYLMDDPLSAVDAHVSAQIFEDVIGPKGTLAQKTRILVTHDLSVLPRCNQVVVMSGGRIIESGPYEALLQSRDGELSRLVKEFAQGRTEEEDLPADDLLASPDPLSLTTEELKAQMRRLGERRLSRTASTDVEPPAVRKGARLIENERMEVGRVRTGVYCAYFRSAGLSLVSIVFAGFVAHQALEIGSNVWLSVWSSDATLPDGSQDIPLRNLRMSVYGLLGLAQAACILVATILLAVASTRASIRLHQSMLRSVVRSPLSFFEVTPIGRILNRFGKDIDSVDVAIPPSLSSVASCLASTAGILVVICLNHPLFLLIMVPVAILYIFFQLFYIATSRQLRRLQSTTLSPLLSFFSESVQGTSTVRAFGCQTFFTQRYSSLLDNNCRVFFASTFVNRWLGVHLELMGAVIVLIVALLSVFQRFDSTAALVGLTLSYALNVTDILRLMVRLITQLETRMVSVERIDEYSKLEEEASWSSDRCHLTLPDWPYEGSIHFKGYRMRYRPDSEQVLKGIDLHIPGGQKVGVVGRTGAGKSSLVQALFRVVEPCDGQLLVDGVDVAALGLHQLRSTLTAIPQDPVIFGGSLRLNVDPESKHSEAEISEVLRLAHLERLPLDAHMEEGGANLSVGERQQVCLARALLRKSRILVLDEATASMDSETDRLIQETLRAQFADSTLLTVAHRLHTVLDYDRILVMDKGRIAEDGAPDTLLKKKNSLFKDLARSAGLL